MGILANLCADIFNSTAEFWLLISIAEEICQESSDRPEC